MVACGMNFPPWIQTEAEVCNCLHMGHADSNSSRTGQSCSLYLTVMTLNPTDRHADSYGTICLFCCQKGTFNTLLHPEPKAV